MVDLLADGGDPPDLEPPPPPPAPFDAAATAASLSSITRPGVTPPSTGTGAGVASAFPPPAGGSSVGEEELFTSLMTICLELGGRLDKKQKEALARALGL